MSNLAVKDFEILSDQEKNEALALLNRYQRLEKQEDCQKDFITFVKSQWMQDPTAEEGSIVKRE